MTLKRIMALVAVWLGACLLTLGPGGAVAQEPDTVILRSGHPVIGEVESLKRGSLSFDTEEMDLVKIDWDDIAFVMSSSFFEVTVVSGLQYYGGLAAADTAVLVVVGATRSDTIPFSQVVAIGPIEPGFWARTNGFIDVGSNITRANSLRSALVNGRFNYRGPKWGFGVGGETYWQRQESVSSTGDTTTQTTRRASAAVDLRRSLGGRWSVLVSGEVEQNQELQLDLRLLGTLGGAYRIIRTQGIEFSTGAGGVINQELFVGEERKTSAELLVAAGFDAFDVGDLDIYTTLTTYTNPTDGGRFRVNFDGRIAWDIFGDFTIGLNITERFDSRPPSASAAKRDYQYALSIGWSWN
jgi:hypothetical protein